MLRQIIKGFVEKHSGNCLACKNLPPVNLVFKFKSGYITIYIYEPDNQCEGFLPRGCPELNDRSPRFIRNGGLWEDGTKITYVLAQRLNYYKKKITYDQKSTERSSNSL